MNQYDVIVVGVGGVGSSTLYHLAKSGAKVLGLDRFSPGHDRGSSHGRKRLIRRVYHEHPGYVPLVAEAYDCWEELATSRDETLFHQIGLLQVGAEDSAIVRGSKACADEHDIPLETLSASEASKRFPGFAVREGMVALLEKSAGYLDVEACVSAYADEAVKAGAELRVGGAVRSWSARNIGVSVETESRSFSADKLVIAPGPWAKDLLLELCIPFEVRRKPLYWYQTTDKSYQEDKGCPAFVFDTADGQYYGFPQTGDLGVKLGEHTGGVRVPDPLGIDRSVDPQDQKRVEAFIADFLPGVRRRCMQHSVCMYTMSPDQHFVIDVHPHHDNVAFAAGFSGHGFKFASVLGRRLAALISGAKTDDKLEFLNCNRPGLRFMDLDGE